MPNNFNYYNLGDNRTDCNNVINTGVYSFYVGGQTSPTQNSPITYSWVQLYVTRSNGDPSFVQQVILSQNNGYIGFRCRENNVWGNWVQILSRPAYTAMNPESTVANIDIPIEQHKWWNSSILIRTDGRDIWSRSLSSLFFLVINNDSTQGDPVIHGICGDYQLFTATMVNNETIRITCTSSGQNIQAVSVYLYR